MVCRACAHRQVDSFSEKAFGGNPAAVFFTQNGGNAEWMQKVGVALLVAVEAIRKRGRRGSAGGMGGFKETGPSGMPMG